MFYITKARSMARTAGIRHVAAWVRVEGSATALVPEDALVDPLVAYGRETLLLEPEADLFEAPVLA
uniref:Uncharacterized protein n=1 Tax=Candidatus Kentrum sp. LFY TaxID=2126342 RepID=A0A450UL44_9GAMM|nr:MAG: hypothetical protein BECKLFY1418A_GA0070994_103020 [Candidatus Kentron sp. LFY]